MATKKSKSRTAKSTLTKKQAFPLWSIVVVVLLIASIGIYFVYNSFATTRRVSGQLVWRNGNTAGKSTGGVIASNATPLQAPKVCFQAYRQGGASNGKFVYRIIRSDNGQEIYRSIAPESSTYRCHTRDVIAGKRYRASVQPAGRYGLYQIYYSLDSLTGA